MDSAAAMDVEQQHATCKYSQSEAPSPPQLLGTFSGTANLFNLLNGVAILSAAYAVQRGGCLGLLAFALLAVLTAYSARLLVSCMEAPALQASAAASISYQDIAAKAFGLKGRIIVTSLVYCERVLVMISYTILIGGSLSTLLPRISLKIAGLRLGSYEFLSIVSVLSVLPLLLAKNIRLISYFSIAGAASTFIVLGTVIINRIKNFDGFHPITILNFSEVPFVTGIYAYGICGNVMIPTVYKALKDPASFNKVIVLSFSSTGILFSAFGLMGALLYGQDVQSPVTLSIGQHQVIWKVAELTIIISSLTKLPLNVSPVADELEAVCCRLGSLTSNSAQFLVRIMVRCLFMLCILTLALSLPYFSEIIALTGSTLEILLSIVIPCIFYLKIFWSTEKRQKLALVMFVTTLGIASTVAGSISSTENLVRRKSQ